MRSYHRAFSLLEVMISLAILVTALTLLVEVQATAILMTKEGERLVTASNLAQEKSAEIVLRLESEGFTDVDVCESGEFDDFGDEVLDAEFGDRLDDYHFEWCVSTVDVALAGDIAGMAGGLAGGGYFRGRARDKRGRASTLRARSEARPIWRAWASARNRSARCSASMCARFASGFGGDRTANTQRKKATRSW